MPKYMEKNITIERHNPDRNAFLNYFKNSNELKSVIFNKLRLREIALVEIKKNKFKFVSQLIGKENADRLSTGEIDVFIAETEKIILENKKMIDDSKRKLEEEALAAGFVDGGFYANDGKKILRGDAEAYQAHLNGENEEK